MCMALWVKIPCTLYQHARVYSLYISYISLYINGTNINDNMPYKQCNIFKFIEFMDSQNVLEYKLWSYYDRPQNLEMSKKNFSLGNFYYKVCTD